MRVVCVPAYGPPDVLTLEGRPDPQPAVGQVVVDVEAIGVNFVDTMLRSGRMAPRAPRVRRSCPVTRWAVW